jgi:uncharacterized membrane protein YkoI
VLAGGRAGHGEPGLPQSQPRVEKPALAPRNTEPAKQAQAPIEPKVVTVDLTALSPELVRELQAAIKPVSRTEAANIAEKAGNGQAVKVEKQGEGVATKFLIDVRTKDGATVRITLNATGNVIEKR